MEYDAVTICDILFINEIPVYKFNDWFSGVTLKYGTTLISKERENKITATAMTTDNNIDT